MHTVSSPLSSIGVQELLPIPQTVIPGLGATGAIGATRRTRGELVVRGMNAYGHMYK